MAAGAPAEEAAGADSMTTVHTASRATAASTPRSMVGRAAMLLVISAVQCLRDDTPEALMDDRQQVTLRRRFKGLSHQKKNLRDSAIALPAADERQENRNRKSGAIGRAASSR